MLYYDIRQNADEITIHNVREDSVYVFIHIRPANVQATMHPIHFPPCHATIIGYSYCNNYSQ